LAALGPELEPKPKPTELPNPNARGFGDDPDAALPKAPTPNVDGFPSPIPNAEGLNGETGAAAVAPDESALDANDEGVVEVVPNAEVVLNAEGADSPLAVNFSTSLLAGVDADAKGLCDSDEPFGRPWERKRESEVALAELTPKGMLPPKAEVGLSPKVGELPEAPVNGFDDLNNVFES
jgi:hypothetical protein